jgi:NAD(P)-dependent dehydrogenase (short-subunit alcohol dehydrogenase family)
MAEARPAGTGVLAGRAALVTGAAGGIGRAIAGEFARAGASVALFDRDAEGAGRVAHEIQDAGGRAIAIAGDVSVARDAARAVRESATALGRLDVLVNNAGIIRRASILETSEAEWDRLMAVNVKSVFLLSKAAVPVMQAGGGGVIVNVASGWGLVGGRRAAAYCASKGAVVQLTRAMALDHAGERIRVVCLCPGDTDTAMLREEARQLDEPETRFLEDAARRPLGRVGRPEDVAHAALYLASDAAAFVTGTVLVVDGGGLA